ncbi:restriction endonuclease subunit S [uncultured Brachyspira sp.]|uniref:restriction endonuclease subunit S n=1 Tax=uncultured Brachyspira sp. TaxID=221953 RepID=UPI003207C242
MHPYFETYSSDIKKIAVNGSVLMSIRVPVGDLNIANADVCIGRGLCSINGKSNIINRYIFYLLSYYKPKLLNMQKGTTFGAIIKDDILNFKVLIAEDIEEQKRIASALSKIDAYLENTIKLIEEKERFKRGIAKKLLTCKEGENIPEARFKGFNDDWRKEKLSSMIKIQGCYAFKSSEFKKSGIPIIRISNISNTDNNMNINMKEIIYYSEIENEKSFIIKKSDLLIALSGAPGKSSIYNLEEKAYVKSNGWII